MKTRHIQTAANELTPVIVPQIGHARSTANMQKNFILEVVMHINDTERTYRQDAKL